VKCRAYDTIAPALRPFCVSYVHPDRPAFYAMVSPSGVMFAEPEYAPTNPATFDDFSSFILHKDVFFPGAYMIELVGRRNHYARGTAGGQTVFAEFEDTPEFKTAASWFIFESTIKGKSIHLSVLSLYLYMTLCVRTSVLLLLYFNFNDIY